MVGLFDAERGSGALWTAGEFNEFVPRALISGDIHNVRAIRARLFKEWRAVAPGEKLELKFELA